MENFEQAYKDEITETFKNMKNDIINSSITNFDLTLNYYENYFKHSLISKVGNILTNGNKLRCCNCHKILGKNNKHSCSNCQKLSCSICTIDKPSGQLCINCTKTMLYNDALDNIRW